MRLDGRWDVGPIGIVDDVVVGSFVESVVIVIVVVGPVRRGPHQVLPVADTPTGVASGALVAL